PRCNRSATPAPATRAAAAGRAACASGRAGPTPAAAPRRARAAQRRPAARRAAPSAATGARPCRGPSRYWRPWVSVRRVWRGIGAGGLGGVWVGIEREAAQLVVARAARDSELVRHVGDRAAVLRQRLHQHLALLLLERARARAHRRRLRHHLVAHHARADALG